MTPERLTPSSKLNSNLLILWKKLTEPDNSLHEVGLRHQIKLLSALLLIALLTAVIGTIVAIKFSPPLIALMLSILSLGLGFSYGLSRTKHYRISAGLSITLLGFTPFLLTAVLANFGDENALQQLIWLIMSIILGSMYFSTKKMIMMIITITTGILILTLFILKLSPTDIIRIIIFFLSSSALIITVAHYRELIAKERQTLIQIYADKQMQINQTLQQEINKRQQAEKRLLVSERHLESLYQIGLELAAELDLDTLLHSIVSRISELLSIRLNGLWLCQPEQMTLELVATSNINQPVVGTIIQYGEGLAGKIAESGQTLVINDYIEWEGNLASFAKTAGHAASAGVPIYWGGKVQGVIGVTAQPEYHFTQTDIQLLTLFAAQTAVVIQNARLHDEAQRYTIKLEQEIIERIEIENSLRNREQEMNLFLKTLQTLHEVSIELNRIDSFDDICYQAIELGRDKLGFDRLALLLYDKETNMMQGTFGTDDHGQLRDERYFSQEVDRPKILAVLKSQSRLGFWEEVELRDEHRPVGHGWNAISVLWDGDQGLGWLATDNLIKKEPPIPYMLEILTLYGATLGHLVTRKRTEEMLKQRAHHLALLNDITNATLQARDFSAMLQVLANRMGELVDADNCFITLWDNEQHKAVPAAGYAIRNDSPSWDTIGSDELTMTESVLNAKQPLVAEDVFNTPYLSPGIAARYSIHSLIGLPLFADDQKLGAVLITFSELHHFTENEVKRCEQAAGQVSLALAQAQLREQLHDHTIKLERKNQELRDFNHVVSHDLQAPLRTIRAFGDRLLHKYADGLDPKGYDYLERSVNAASRMQILIQNLLTFSQVTTQAQQFTEVSLNQVIQDVLSDLEVQILDEGATVKVGKLPTILADEIQMCQLFQNLIGNALKFHRKDVSPLIQITAEQEENNWFKISVKDNGIGFDQKFTERIFNMFQRLHTAKEYEGTGAGLAICRRIVERHLGQMTAVSQLGEGATFIIQLPANQLDV